MSYDWECWYLPDGFLSDDEQNTLKEEKKENKQLAQMHQIIASAKDVFGFFVVSSVTNDNETRFSAWFCVAYCYSKAKVQQHLHPTPRSVKVYNILHSCTLAYYSLRRHMLASSVAFYYSDTDNDGHVTFYYPALTKQ